MILMRLRHAFDGETDYDPGEDPVHDLTLPAIVEGLGRTVLLGRTAPSQATVVDKNNAAHNLLIIHALAAVALGEVGAKARNLRFHQLEQVAHGSGLLAAA